MKNKQQTKLYRKWLPLLLVVLLYVFSMNRTIPVHASGLQLEIRYDQTMLTKALEIEIVPVSSSEITMMKYAYEDVTDSLYFTENEENGTTIEKNEAGEYSFFAGKVGYISIFAMNQKGEEALSVFYIDNIDTEAPELTITSQQMNHYYLVTANASDSISDNVTIRYTEGAFASIEDAVWNTAEEYGNEAYFVLKEGKYTFLATDEAGNEHIKIQRFGKNTANEEEFRAVWISYLEFNSNGYKTKKEFQEHIDTMFNEVVAMNMNAVVVHVRPFGDAMYDSDYFPWSRYASGSQGKSPGFDPLEIMVKEAHARGLEFHAWLNPYRVTSGSTDVKNLSEDNPARIYRTDNKKSNDRNVLTYSGNLYYNPSVDEVQTLLINGIKEIVKNYDVDGIHFDDYFYPSLGKNFTSNFDAPEYEEYKKYQLDHNKDYLSIADWRRENVNTLVRNVYSAVKKVNPDVVFGISPGGFMDALKADDKYYVDFETWLGHDGYIDYFCPQLYWSNDHSIYPYNDILERFIDAAKNPDVKFYVGIAAYKAGTKSEEPEWYQNPNVLRDMITYARKTNKVDGFILFRYDYLISKRNYTSMKNMMKEFK